MSGSSKPGVKVLLIPVLLGFLVYQVMGDSSDLKAVTDETSLEVPSSDPANSKSMEHWPDRSLAAVLEFDPFGTIKKPMEEPVLVEEDKPSEVVVVIPKTIKLDLKAIYQTRNGRVALVGDEIVRAGQRLADGALVIAIHDDSIEVQPAVTPLASDSVAPDAVVTPSAPDPAAPEDAGSGEEESEL